MLYRALIFDLDGVVIDSEALHSQAVVAAAAAYGVDLPPAIFDEFMGIPDSLLLVAVAERYLGGAVDPALLLAEKQRVYLDLLETQLQPIPGAVAFIAAVRPRVEALALVTSSLRSNQQRAFARFGLAPYFDVVVTAEDITQPKPHPEPYQVAVARLGLPAADCLVLEDSLHGIRSALDAGCQVLGLATTYGVDALLGAGAGVVCRDYAEVARVVAG